MTALSADRNTERQDRVQQEYPVAASTTIYAGSMVCMNATGYAIPAEDTAGLQLVGVAEEQADNSSGSAGDINVKVRQVGAHEMTASGLTIADEGKPCWISDDQTVSKTPANVFAGIIRDYISATSCYLDIEPAVQEVHAITVRDTSRNELLEWGITSSAENHVKITNAADGNAPLISAVGDDTNIDLELKPKGSGNVTILDGNGNEVVKTAETASAVNEITVTNAATGANPTIASSGEADTGIDFENSEGEEMLILEAVDAAVNEITVTNATTGNNPTIACTGEADTGIDFENSEGEEILILDAVATAVNEITVTNATTGNHPTIACTGEADTGIDFENSEGEEILILDAAATAVNELTLANAATGAEPSISATGDDTNIGMDLVTKGTGLGSLVGDDTDVLQWQKDTNAKIGFLGATPNAQLSHVADPSGGGTQDAEARSAINSILTTLETFGFHATS